MAASGRIAVLRNINLWKKRAEPRRDGLSTLLKNPVPAPIDTQLEIYELGP